MTPKPTYEELERRVRELEKIESELRRKEAALRKSERKYQKLSGLLRLMCDNVPDMIWAKDLEKKYIFANRAICKNLLNATDTEETIGKTDIFFAERERKRFSDNPEWHTFGEICSDSDQITMEAGIPMQFDEFGNVRGKFLFLDVHKAPFIDADGNMIGTVGSGRDITERKRADDALRDSNERLTTVLDSMDAHVYIADMETYEVLFSNLYGRKAWGDSRGQKCWSVFQKDQDGPCAFCTNEKLLDIDGKPTGVHAWELQNTANGRWFDCRDVAIPWTDGRMVRMEIATDITEHKRAEEKLRHRLVYEQMLSRISTMAVQHKDLEQFLNDSLTIMGETLDISRAYLFEYHHETDSLDNTVEWCAPEESPQKDNLQGLPSAASPWWMEELRDVGTICFSDIEDIPDEGAKEILRPQGICSILVVPLFVAGRFYGFMGFDECRFHREWPEEDVELLLAISRIITGALYKKQSEEEIERERQQLLSIFNSIEESIYISDPKTYEVLYVNPKLVSILQRDCVGGICHKEFQGLDEPCAFCTNDIILKHKPQPHYWEYYNQNLEKHFSIVDRIIDWPDGRRVRFEMATDITKRKQAEAEREKLQIQLLQSQKMESVGRLAGGVAHDFNNMLGVILGHVEFALEEAEKNQSLYSDLKEIQKAARRSADTTKQLLAFARKEIISPKQIDLNDTVESMLNMLRRLIGEDIDLVWQPAARLWPVKMDPSQIDQIFANLCVNARDAISGVGKLTIETGKQTFDEKYCSDHPGFIPGDFVLLAVSDNGCGMDKDTLNNLFEPFFTTKEVGKGTGLGLATIYGIVKQNNGFINVYSEPGQGSTFKIYLPRLIADEDADKTVREKKAAAGGTETILLVEDEPSILRMIKMMLKRKGYSVLSAATPAEAVEKAKNHSGAIDLLMTDVIMPEMHGQSLAEKITDIYPDIRLLFMSGYTADVIAHHGILDEGVAFIQKPFSMADLAEKLREVLETASDKT